jgi:hypothetical protein
MLLWETLTGEAEAGAKAKQANSGEPVKRAVRGKRLPYDKRCAALARSGHRCKGRIREGSDYCTFHDPAMTAERRRRIAAKGGKSRRNLAHLPGGYLRKLNSRHAVGQAMDRLYREIRVGILTPEMGRVLFDILTRMLDSGLCDHGQETGKASGRTRAEKLRPKLKELLAPAEMSAWRKAVANAPDEFFGASQDTVVDGPLTGSKERVIKSGRATKAPVQDRSTSAESVSSSIPMGGLSVAT